MPKEISVTGLVLVALFLLGVPLFLFSYWLALPILGLHVAALVQLSSPERRSTGMSLARVTGFVGAGLVVLVYLVSLPASGYLGPQVLAFALGPAFLAHSALALTAAEAGTDRRGAWLGLAVLAGLALAGRVLLAPIGNADLRAHGDAIQHVRTMIAAQSLYASINGGFYDSPACLESPADCLPGYSESEPWFIGPEIMGTKDAYRRQFHPGPPAEVEEGSREQVSPSSIRSFAFVVAPTIPGETADRAYCGDSTGSIRFSADGSMPEIRGGLCPESLPLLE